MHDDQHFLLNALYLLFAAVIAVPLFRKLGLGAILGYLAAGLVLGPSVSGLMDDPQSVLHFAELGVIMLLFLIGLELAPQKLWQMRSQILFTGGSQLLFSAALIAFAMLALALPLKLSILLGLTLGLSSTAFAVQLMAEQKILASPAGREGFSILLLQDLAVIPLLLFVESLASNPTTQETSTPWWYGLLAVIALLLAGRYLVNPMLRLIANSGSREVMTGAALLLVLGVSVLMESVGLSMGLGAFVAGIILANSSFRHQLETDVEPFKGLLLGLFFIAVGMSLDLKLLRESPLLIVGAAIALVALKTLVIAVILRLKHLCFRDSVLLGLMLSQGGEFAFVVLSQATALAVIPSELADKIVLVVGISMALTSPLVALLNLLWRSNTENETHNYDTQSDTSEPEVIIAGFGRFGQVVGRMLAANGIPFTALDKDANHVDFVKRYGNRVFFGDATQLDLLRNAGISHARLVVVAVDDAEESIRIVELCRQHCDNVNIVARAHNRMHAYELHHLEVNNVIRETFESSLVAAGDALMRLGYTEGQALERVDMFRLHDERMLEAAIAHKDDFDRLLNIASEGRLELEQLFALDTTVAK